MIPDGSDSMGLGHPQSHKCVNHYHINWPPLAQVEEVTQGFYAVQGSYFLSLNSWCLQNSVLRNAVLCKAWNILWKTFLCSTEVFKRYPFLTGSVSLSSAGHCHALIKIILKILWSVILLTWMLINIPLIFTEWTILFFWETDQRSRYNRLKE